ncbi:hypothetical protein DEU56DRAFT_788280 [Suillus clintonianus]|uniref:uncharacterized protein n=1 Tax=Suillus clintonianus TaxID=1904413 RepID=UPI001B86FE55|nr:uncharacterized protein DEU56DRAFT_788280 [Suillus clintonianus]KAG2145828.1 hypothetical protein DEU56DRAFT_788280 [Suillus clintonianus]
MSSSLSLPSTPTFATPGDQPTTSQTSGAGGNQQPSTSTTLYLFTFLATLFVLLLISASIIFRSFLVRRRFRRRVEDALAQGAFFDLPPSALGLTSRFIGEKPSVHEAWVEQDLLQEKAQWHAIMPVTALLTHRVEPAAESRLPHEAPQQQRPSFLARFKRHSVSPDSHPATIIRDCTSPDDTVSVCVLITMPHPDSPMRFKHSSEYPAKSQLIDGKYPNLGVTAGRASDEEGVPNVVFGVAELPVVGGWTEVKMA